MHNLLFLNRKFKSKYVQPNKEKQDNYDLSGFPENKAKDWGAYWRWWSGRVFLHDSKISHKFFTPISPSCLREREREGTVQAYEIQILEPLIYPYRTGTRIITDSARTPCDWFGLEGFRGVLLGFP